MAGVRRCEQCGAAFVPRREHARFCSGHCRVVLTLGDSGSPAPAAGLSALEWSVTAMNDLAARLVHAGAWDRPAAAAVVGEMVWQVTLVDATLVRYHPENYDAILSGYRPPRRQHIEGTLAGLRFVRNQLRRPDFAGWPSGADGPVTTWAWPPAARPAGVSQPPDGQLWELSRYHAYQEFVAGRSVGKVSRLAVDFLTRAAAFSIAPGAPGAAFIQYG
jgi:hypothetical protein